MIFNSLIFDKSTFQSLNSDEIFFLRTYYSTTITHILIIEILADLKKHNDDSSTLDRVADLSNKILQLKPNYNVSYKHLLKMNLLGYNVEMLGRPNVDGGKSVVNTDGKRGIVFQQAIEEQVLHRWRNGKFDEAEELLADLWRNSINNIEIQPDSLPRPNSLNRLKNISDIVAYVDSYFDLPQAQSEILQNILAVYTIPQETASNIFYRFEQSEKILIKDFSPYALFCYRILLTFHLSQIRGISTPRKTDIIDLQYLYYLPFSTIFTSDDKFHKMFTPPFLLSDQSFISGVDLKTDLETIVKLRASIPTSDRDAWMDKYKHIPPENNSSFTYRIWDKNVNSTYRNWTQENHSRTREEEQELLNKLKRFRKNQDKVDQSKPFNDEDTDFIIKESWIGPNDYCPCESGKLFKDCHLPDVKKNNSK